MKRCPTCQKQYADDTLNFCLDDGAWLTGAGASNEIPTVMMPAPTREAATQVFANVAADMTIAMADEAAANSIAVLPFTHLSSDAEDEYFCDGLAEELINELAQVEGLKVVARTSAFSFKGKTVDVGQIGKILNVTTVLEGSVRRSGDRLRITVQLINTYDGFHIWSDRYDRELRDVFELQDEITVAVVGALKTKLFGKDEDLGLTELIEDLKHYKADVGAYELYLRGRFFLNKFTAENFLKAKESFEQAIAIDGAFPEAYAGLADAYMMLTEMGPMPPHEAMPKAKEAALKALSLDEGLSEAHASLGLVLQDYEFQFASAEECYRRAIELNPNNSMAHQSYGQLLAQLGRHDEAEAEFLKALAVDPLSPVGNWGYAFGLFEARRYDDCLAQSDKTLEFDPGFAAAYLSKSFVFHMKGDYAASVDAYATFAELCGSSDTSRLIRESFRAGGWKGFLETFAGANGPTDITSYIVAVFRAALGDVDGAIAKLDKALAKREPHIVMLKVDPRFDGIRADLRFQQILKAIGFPE